MYLYKRTKHSANSPAGEGCGEQPFMEEQFHKNIYSNMCSRLYL